MTLGTIDVLNLVAVAAVALMLAFTGFWSFNVRRALLVRVYRRQALGTALIAFLLALTLVVGTFEAYLYAGGGLAAIGQGAFGLFFIFLLVLFYWVDASVIAVRRSDPKARDTLHWSRLRLLLFALSLPGQLLGVAVSVIGSITSGLASAATSSAPSPGSPVGDIVFVLLVGAIFIPPASAVIMLPIIARRTADLTFRSQLIWFGGFAVAYLVLVSLLGEGGSGWSTLAFQYFGLVVCAFCLRRSVSALVPAVPSIPAEGQIGLAPGVRRSADNND